MCEGTITLGAVLIMGVIFTIFMSGVIAGMLLWRRKMRREYAITNASMISSCHGPRVSQWVMERKEKHAAHGS